MEHSTSSLQHRETETSRAPASFLNTLVPLSPIDSSVLGSHWRTAYQISHGLLVSLRVQKSAELHQHLLQFSVPTAGEFRVPGRLPH